jgi:hypothetical protein
MNFPLHDIMSGLVMGGAGDAAATHSNSWWPVCLEGGVLSL